MQPIKMTPRRMRILELLRVAQALPADPEVQYELGKLFEEEGDLPMASHKYNSADRLANGEGKDWKPRVPKYRTDAERMRKAISQYVALTSDVKYRVQ